MDLNLFQEVRNIINIENSSNYYMKVDELVNSIQILATAMLKLNSLDQKEIDKYTMLVTSKMVAEKLSMLSLELTSRLDVFLR
jgi:hypothetical protein